jgi:glycosyltransferase involved in cell wall biosynthesis
VSWREGVSCIVPVFNGGAHVAGALNSILTQSHAPLEVIVVDDGSTDETSAVLASYGERIEVVRQSNAGPAAARNHGIRTARGALIAFLDQDDLWHREKLARQVAHLDACRHVDVSVASVESFWSEGDGREAARERDQPRSGAVPGYVTTAMLARRGVFDRVGPFRSELRYADSLDWFARAAECGVVIDLIPDVLVRHRVHGSNLSRQGAESRRECVAILRQTLARRRARAAG